MTHRYWDNKLNPLPERAEHYLDVVKGEHFTGHPVKDLVEIVFDCYGILSSILTNYNPTGDDSQDKCVVALSQLFVHWPADKLALIKDSMDNLVPEDRSHHKHLETSNEHVRESEGGIAAARATIAHSMSKVISGIGFGTSAPLSPSTTPKAPSSPRKPTHQKNRSGESDTDDTQGRVANTRSPSNSPPRKEKPPSPSSKSESTVLIPPIPPTVSSTPSLSDPLAFKMDCKGRSSGTSGSHELSTKNQEYFRKMREEEEVAQRTKMEEVSKLTPEEIKRIEDERKEAERHDASKTAHLSKLGSNFLNKKDGRVKTDGGGRGGRGRGGRG